MKWSGSGTAKPRGERHSACLIVDGYNVIARQEQQRLSAIVDLEAKRDDLLAQLSEYGAFSGQEVVVVFDAGHTPERAVDERRGGVRLIYTAAGETADQRIERLVYELRDTYHRITVATSDAAEQQVTFGGGALRISAAELVRHMAETKRRIEHAVEKGYRSVPRIDETLSEEVAKKLEDWRRQ
jgi:predicted RNA-binding protein with PIN domain